MSEPVTRRLVIRGHVQGVFYRESMREQAARLGITGWVRNCRDGSVEAVIQGGPEAVDAMIAWSRRGPSDARVSEVQAEPAEGEFRVFEKRPTF